MKKFHFHFATCFKLPSVIKMVFFEELMGGVSKFRPCNVIGFQFILIRYPGVLIEAFDADFIFKISLQPLDVFFLHLLENLGALI